MAHGAANRAHLHVACGFVTNTWFPTLDGVVARVREGLQSNRYRESPQALLDDLRYDFGLFTLLLGRLRSRRWTENATPMSPRAILLDGLERGALVEVMDPEVRLARHSIGRESAHTSLQLQRLNAAIISASTAELLADARGIESEEAASCALLRQLGLTLIAWNYPAIYERALTEVREGDSVEARIDALLGFSPAMLGAALAERWHLATEYQEVLGAAVPGVPTTPPGRAGEIARLCEIGETLARASDPLHFKNSDREWERAREVIERELGSEGIPRIYGRVRELSSEYHRALPATFPRLEESQPQWSPEATVAAAAPAHKDATNRYVERCDLSLQRTLIELYSNTSTPDARRDALTQLATTIAPRAGFVRGCIYLVDPVQHYLVPRYALGSLALAPLKPISLRTEENIFTIAYQRDTPIIQEGVLSDGAPILLITGALGIAPRIGVFYLESMPLTALPFGRTAGDHQGRVELLTNHYKAIREAIAYLLRVE